MRVKHLHAQGPKNSAQQSDFVLRFRGHSDLYVLTELEPWKELINFFENNLPQFTVGRDVFGRLILCGTTGNPLKFDYKRATELADIINKKAISTYTTKIRNWKFDKNETWDIPNNMVIKSWRWAINAEKNDD